MKRCLKELSEEVGGCRGREKERGEKAGEDGIASEPAVAITVFVIMNKSSQIQQIFVFPSAAHHPT
jgi:hypothetical protein